MGVHQTALLDALTLRLGTRPRLASRANYNFLGLVVFVSLLAGVGCGRVRIVGNRTETDKNAPLAPYCSSSPPQIGQEFPLILRRWIACHRRRRRPLPSASTDRVR